MESEFDSYEDLEVKVWKLEHENDKLHEENEKLKELAYTPKGFEWKGCCEQAEAGIKELTSQVAVLREALEQIVSVHSMHCDHHINVSRHSYQLANMANEALSTIDDEAEKMLEVVRAAERMQDSSGDCYEAQAGAERLLMDAVKAYKVATNK